MQVAREENGWGLALNGTSVPSQALSTFVAALDVSLLVLASTQGSVLYRLYATGDAAPQDNATGVTVLTAFFFLLLSRSRGLYRLDVVLRPSGRSGELLFSLGLSLLAVTCVLFLLKTSSDYSRGAVVVFATMSAILLPMGRAAAASAARFGIARGLVRGRPVVTIGDPVELEKFRSSDFFYFGVDEIARIPVANAASSNDGLSRSAEAHVARAIDIARRQRAVGFALVMPWNRDREVSEIANLLRFSPLPVSLLPDHRVRRVLAQEKRPDVGPYYSVTIQREPLSRWERSVKRVFDFALAATALAVIAPLLAFAAAAVKLDSPGPVIFRQRRQGFDGREFVIFKFRTMKVLEDGEEIRQATRNDNRVTRVGKILRRSSIDELPQLWNVVRGDMSIVGPRPHALAHDEEYGARIDTYAMRRHVKPGLTGAAQVMGLRGETRHLSQMTQRVERDLWYINNWSLRLDLKIIALTCYAMLKHDAY
jgi:putative colanic acid biosynthesis UDP-glucose lipid carrier transferase